MDAIFYPGLFESSSFYECCKYLYRATCTFMPKSSPDQSAEYGKSRRDLACAYPFLAAFTACNTKQKSGTRACMVDGVCLLA